MRIHGISATRRGGRDCANEAGLLQTIGKRGRPGWRVFARAVVATATRPVLLRTTVARVPASARARFRELFDDPFGRCSPVR